MPINILFAKTDHMIGPRLGERNTLYALVGDAAKSLGKSKLHKEGWRIGAFNAVCFSKKIKHIISHNECKESVVTLQWFP